MAQPTRPQRDPRGTGPDYGDVLDFGDGVKIPRSTGPSKPDDEVETVTYDEIPPFPEMEQHAD